MNRIIKQSLILFLIVMLTAFPFASATMAQGKAESKATHAGNMIFDLLLLRPVGIAATVIGSALFVVSLPFSAVGGNTRPAYEKMVREPARYTFARPLGQY